MSTGAQRPDRQIRRQRAPFLEHDGLGFDAPHRRLHLELDAVRGAELPHVGVERRRGLREETLSRFDERDVQAAVPVTPQDLPERLHALEPAPDDHHPRGLAARGETGEALADAVALLDRLEGKRVLEDPRDAAGRIHTAERDDQGVVADRLATTLRFDRAPDRVDLRHCIAHERVARAPDVAVEGQAKQLRRLHSREQLVDVGKELEPAAAIDECHLVSIRAQLQRGGEAREAAAQNDHALSPGRAPLHAIHL
jgi:hypothetical protein